MRSETCPPLRPGIRPSRDYSLCREWHSEPRLFEDRKLHEAILCRVPAPTRYAPGVPGYTDPRPPDWLRLQIPAPVLPSLTRAPALSCEEQACVPDRPSSK